MRNWLRWSRWQRLPVAHCAAGSADSGVSQGEQPGNSRAAPEANTRPDEAAAIPDQGMRRADLEETRHIAARDLPAINLWLRN